jgi:hypothetical protein
VVRLRRKFWFPPFFTLLRPGVEPDETVFKGVQFMQITLNLVGLRATEQGDRYR